MDKKKLVIIGLWIVLWQLASVVSRDKIFFVGPVDVVISLAQQWLQADFWISIAMSMGKIGVGFLGAFLLGIIIGIGAYRFPIIRDLLSPIMSLMKSVPVASFVILALIWMGSSNLSVLISFLIVFPVIYTNTISGLNAVDGKLLEMAKIFRMKRWYMAMAIYKPSLMPYLISSCRVALGMAWKSGIAAEVIGVPDFSIGEKLYTSKIYMDTAGLFAWTLVIVFLSVFTEKLVLAMLKAMDKRYLLDLVPLRSENKEERGKGKYTLSARLIKKSFGDQVVLEGYSLTLASDGIYCLMGPSGRGKTTLLNMLCGITKPDDGEINDFTAMTSSVVFQEDRLQERLSATRNVQIVCNGGVSKEDIVRNLCSILPENCLYKPVKELSGGMKRRVAICRAVAHKSDMLIMDEPFTGLDKESKLKAIEYIKAHRNGRLLIISTHNEEDLQLLGAEVIRL